MNAHAETSLTQWDYDADDYLRRLISARIPEVEAADLWQGLRKADADAVPVDVLAHVVHVLDLIERRLERLEELA
jgi:hypothetical protein